MASETAEVILANFSSVFSQQMKKAKENDFSVLKAGIGFPGPFDYEKGICLLKGISKYDSIYGVCLKELWEQQFHIPFFFANDADLYTLGECFLANGKGYQRVMCVCIGTGLGSGFFDRPNLVKTGDTVPADGFVYHLPYRNSIVDHYLSATGLRNQIKEHRLSSIALDVKELADLARSGNQVALSIFHDFGNGLADILPPVAEKFHSELLIIGGQIAKSADLYITPLKGILTHKNIELKISNQSSNLALQAACLL